MSKYVITLYHTEVVRVEADNEDEAIHKAYAQADSDYSWDGVDVEETEKEEEE